MVCTVQWIKFGNDVALYIKSHHGDGSCIHPIGALNNERQRRVDRTNRIQNNDYKSSIKRPALICFKKTETVQSI